MKKRSIICALAFLFTSIAIGPPIAWAQAQESSAAQLNAIEKKIEKDQFGDEMYAQLDSIITKEPTNFRAHLYLGNCYAKLGLPDQAIEEFKLATKHGPNEPKAYVELVKQQIKLGQIPAAMELLEEAGRKFPNDPEVQFWIGNSLLKKGRFPEAEVAFKMAIAKKQKILGLTSALAELKLMQGDFPNAKILAKQDLEIDPNFALANRIYGLALASTGHFEASIPYLEKAYTITPFKEGLAENLAACAAWAGQWHVALEPAIISVGGSASLDQNNPKQKAMLYNVFRHVPAADIEPAIRAASIKAGKHPPAAFFFALGDVLDNMNMRKLAIEQYQRGLEEAPAFGRAWFRLGKDLEIYAKDYPAALQCYEKAHAFKMEDKEIAMAMYSLSDKLSRRNLDWSWKLKDVLKPPKKVSVKEPETAASASSTR